ncbi:MAG: isoleucine--tRNA ligase [Chloroflexi bacterium]|nr:isoleucine--tRNA ligase [Chloroflexota bacterium]MDA1228717.1 isoleucine--tRNA ligase [Chloroflexota bacterium]
MFKPVDSKVDFPALEERILSWWEENDIPAKYRKRNEGAEKRSSFIDGPITANNPMGVHHAWGRSYKDLFLRYKAMQGYDQRFQNGFDGQGLWIEVEVEKELGFKSKRDIEAFGVDKFVNLCKERVDRFAKTISEQSVRLGYWMDWDNSYHTKSDENNYTIWHFLKTCFQKGWMYKGRDVMPWCPRCGTGLSEHEIVTEGYKEIVHPGLFVKLPIIDRENESLLVWTTTPWTLTSNIAAAVHPEKTYVKVKQGDDVFYMIKERASILRGEHEILQELPSSELVGLRYRGPFDELPAQAGVEHRVVAWDEVSESEGTGIVHIAPGAGKEDFALGKEVGLAVIAPLDEHGDFIEGFGWLTGQNVYDVNDPIYTSLKEKGAFYRLDQYSHRYPVCWRCDSELVFRLVDEWFISMEELRHKIADVTRKIRWVPSFGMERELDWLRNMDDWMISKKRYYGLALPIYKCDCGWVDVIGSKTELEERAVEGWDEFQGHSPHKPWIDAVKIQCADCGERVSRISDVGNAWLDAGIVPFSTLKYNDDKDYWKKWFPADWISESFPGQFRNWFYSLLTMSTALENTEPFKAVFSYALMRDETGAEMHKSKGNAIWFEDAADKMGVDSMRWVFARQNPAANVNFGFGTADEVRRRFIIPLWNVYSFFVTYANIDQYDPATPAPPINERSELDRWIVSELNQLVAEVIDALNAFEPDRAARAAEGFMEYLSNWYVRRSRRRFWKAGIVSEQGGDQDKLSAYSTLYECLTTLIKLLAPFMPFLTEDIYQNLVRSQASTFRKVGSGYSPWAILASAGQYDQWSNFRPMPYESIHMDDYPVADEALIDHDLSESTRLAMRLSSLGRASRQNSGLKVRQPLSVAVVSIPKESERKYLKDIAAQLRDELNVVDVKDASEVEGVIRFEIRPNFQLLGPKYGKDMNNIRTLLEAADSSVIAAQVASGEAVKLDGFDLLPEEVLVEQYPLEGYSAASEAGYAVAVSTEITEELRLEGQARELVHRIQNMRRSADFDISDHIVTYYQGDVELDRIIEAHGEYIRQETLSRELLKSAPAAGAYVEDHDMDGLAVKVGVKK